MKALAEYSPKDINKLEKDRQALLTACKDLVYLFGNRGESAMVAQANLAIKQAESGQRLRAKS